MRVDVRSGGIIRVTDDFLKKFRGQAFLDRARGVSMARGMGGLSFYSEAIQHGIVVAAAEVGGDLLPLVSGEQQFPGCLCGEVGKIWFSLRTDRNDAISSGFCFFTTDYIGLVIIRERQGE